MAQPRIQHKRGPTGPTSASGITAGEFAIRLGTGPAGPFEVYVGISGGTTPVRVGAQVVENFSNLSHSKLVSQQAIAEYVGAQFASQVTGVCFMEGPAEGQGTIDIKQSYGGPGSGFSGFLGVTFQISFAKNTAPDPGDLNGGTEAIRATDANGVYYNHKVLVGDGNDGLNPKAILLGEFLGYVGHCGGDFTIDEYGKGTITKIIGSSNGGLGFTALGLTFGEIPVWTTQAEGWTAARLLGGTGIQVTTSSSGGITLGLEKVNTLTSGVYGNASTSPLQIPVFTVDDTGRITVAADDSISLYNVQGGFTAYVNPIFNSYFDNGSTFFSGDSISSDVVNGQIILTNTGVTGISINGTYYTGGIVLSAGSGITLSVSGSNPETVTIGSLGVVGASGYISFQGHTQGNVHLANATGSNNLVFIKGGYRDGFDPNTGTCGYAVFVGLSSGIQLPSNISSSSNAFISIPTGLTGFGGFGGVCFGSQLVSGGTGGARGFLEVNRIQATGNNRISTGWTPGSIAGTVLELDARGGTVASETTNTIYDGRNAKIVLASYPSDQWNLVTDINGVYNSGSLAAGYQIGGPNLNNPLPGLSGIANAVDIRAGTVRLYKNARVEKHLVVGGNIYVLGNYFDNTGATVEFAKIAYIANNNFLGTNGVQGFQHNYGATFGAGLMVLGASYGSGLSGDSGIIYRVKTGNASSGATSAFFGFHGPSMAFIARVATTTSGISSANSLYGPMSFDSPSTVLAPIFAGSINGITLDQHTSTARSLINIAGGHRLGLCGAFGLTFGITGNNTVVIPVEGSQPTTLVTLTNTQTITNKTIGQDCIIDCGTY
jgi:hypothetical protein